MLKLNASYSKKVPAEEEYSSKSFHASVEVELATGLNSIELQQAQCFSPEHVFSISVFTIVCFRFS